MTNKAKLEQMRGELRTVSRRIEAIVESGGRISLTDPLSVKFGQLRRKIQKFKLQHIRLT